MARVLAALLCALALAAPATASGAVQPPGTNDVGGFRNVLCCGQGRSVNLVELGASLGGGQTPPAFTNQLTMYTGLVGASPGLTDAKLGDHFKPAGFGVAPADVVRTDTPRPGVTILRDRFNVPHVYGDTRADVMYGAGYATAQDRMFMMDVLRHTARSTLTALIGPGENNSTVRMDAEQLKVADYSEAELQQILETATRDAGAEGALLRKDLGEYVAGINRFAAQARTDPTTMPGEYTALSVPLEDWKETDTVAIASLIGGIFGRGGGNEARVSAALTEAGKRFGAAAGRKVFDDFRAREDPEANTTLTRRFPFFDPGRPNAKAIARIDAGSVKPYDPAADALKPAGGGVHRNAPWAARLTRRGLGLAGPSSNALLVSASRSASGRALAVMGPQVGYYSPEILLELDLHGGGIDARGAAFPGISLYVLLGRGRDFAWSATTATTDNVDEFAEQLCNPDGSAPTLASRSYVYKGKCVPLVKRDVTMTSPGPSAGDPQATPTTYTLHGLRSVHGPIQSFATVRGKPVAIAEARSTYFHELDSAIAFARLNAGQVRNPREFHSAVSKVNFLFNWFYADKDSIAMLQSGWFPRRAKGTDPDQPAWGTGKYDWQGFKPAAFTSKRMPVSALPKAIDPAQGYLVNWNNKQAPGWRAADDNLAYGPVHRVLRLQDRLRARLEAGKITLTQLTQVMEDAATVDLRGSEVYPLLRAVIGKAADADPEAGPLLKLLDAWAAAGAHRRDLDGDNVLDESAAVMLMDRWWPRLVPAVFQPVLGNKLLDVFQGLMPFDDPANPGGSAYFAGWWGYLSKDLRTLLGRRVRGPYSRKYCGKGVLAKCRSLLVLTLEEAAKDVAARTGSPDPARWKRPATCAVGQSPAACDQIEFTAAGAIETPPIPWQDRPTFQQVVEAQG